jgi:hypothetical protein
MHMADNDSPQGLLTLVCITCGQEKHFSDPPPAVVRCEKCQGRVFRNFFTPVEADEATPSPLDETARSFAYDDESPAVTPDELRDLDAHNEPPPESPRT